MIARVLLALMVCGTAAVCAQSPASTAPPAPSDAAARVARLRTIIENRQDSMVTRVAQAEQLLEMPAPEAIAAAAAMLANGDVPTTKMVVCQAITHVGRRAPERLGTDLVAPLLALIGDANEDVARRAGEALSAFADVQVTESLSALAADANEPQGKRLAALAALTPNSHRRPVAAALVALLDAQDPRIVAGAIDALKTVAAADHGADVAAWRAWWTTRESLSDAQWLDALLRLRTQRLHNLELLFQRYRGESEARYTELANRLAETLAAAYRLTPQAEQPVTLVEWLGDANAQYRIAAAAIVAEQISEGNLPSEAVRAALVRRYGDESPEVRKRAIEIVGALNEPADAGAMLDRLKLEQDESVRETVLRVLGKLRNATAVGPLIEELTRPGATDSAVATAADALGMLASRSGLESDVRDSMIVPLKDAFARGVERGPSVRVAILGAMAATGSPLFKPEFEDHLAAEDPELLLRAIQGVAVVGNGAQLDRLSNLATHADARVRQRAVAALGDLGGTDQLSTVVARMSPGVETVEGPRQAAWKAFRAICARLPMAAQVSSADRLVDLPPFRIRYLKELHDQLVKTTPPPAELSRVREMLARAYVALGRNSEALPYWRTLFNDAVLAKHPRLHEIAMAYLDCAVAGDKTDDLPEILFALADADKRSQQTAEATVLACFDRLRAAGREGDIAPILTRLADLSVTAFDGVSTYLPPDPDPAPSVDSNSSN